jgi:NTP pyrophosphatase (non-canonical NTP hydrolase)
MILNDIIIEMLYQHGKAIKKHPDFPKDVIHMVSIMAEEAGETIQAANDAVYHNGSLEDVKKEIYHTMATCIRCLDGIDSLQKGEN